MGVRVPPGLRGDRAKSAFKMNKVAKFINEVKIELKKVSWSTRRELINATIVVIISVAILAVYIGLCDLIWSNAINFIMR